MSQPIAGREDARGALSDGLLRDAASWPFEALRSALAVSESSQPAPTQWSTRDYLLDPDFKRVCKAEFTQSTSHSYDVIVFEGSTF